MAVKDDIREGMEVIGADGVHVGIVDKIEGDRIKLNRHDEEHGLDEPKHHFLSLGLVAEVEEDKVRVSSNAANAELFEEEEGAR